MALLQFKSKPSIPKRANLIPSILRNFIGRNQLLVLEDCLRGEEKDYFINKLNKLAKLIEEMPATYEQDGKGENAIAYLHYFRGNMDWFITEKDKGAADDEPEDKGKQFQAFGSANLGYGAEMGYISIQELIENNIEIDLHFTPRKLKDCEK